MKRASIELHSDPLVKAGLPPKRPSYSTLAVAVPPSQRKSSRLMLQPPSQDAQTRSREAFDRLKADLDQRKPASKRMRWPDPKDDKQRRLMAESAFHQGRMWLHAEEAERALPGLHRALELRPEEREYELYVKWAQMLVNDTFKEDGQRASIQALAAKLVRENRDCELGHSILGHCTHHDSFDDAALRFFARASMLDPKLVDAARLARLLAQRANGGERPRPGTRPGSRPDLRAPGTRRRRGSLDPSIDEIVPGLATKPIFSGSRVEPTPKAPGAKSDENPNSHRTFDGVGPAPVAAPAPRPNSVPPPMTEKLPDKTKGTLVVPVAPRVADTDRSGPPAMAKVPSKPPPPLRVAQTQQSPQVPMMQPQRTPSPPVPVVALAAPPPVAPHPGIPSYPPPPLGFPPTMPIPVIPAMVAGLGAATWPLGLRRRAQRARSRMAVDATAAPDDAVDAAAGVDALDAAASAAGSGRVAATAAESVRTAVSKRPPHRHRTAAVLVAFRRGRDRLRAAKVEQGRDRDRPRRHTRDHGCARVRDRHPRALRERRPERQRNGHDHRDLRARD